MSNPAQPKQPSNDLIILVGSGIVVVAGLVVAILWSQHPDVDPRRQDKAVISNLRELQAGADQYFLENGVSSVASSTIVSTVPGAMIPSTVWSTVAQETYTAAIVQGQGISAAGVAGARTVTFGP
jgi:type IV pilus assembly protein PilA